MDTLISETATKLLGRKAAAESRDPAAYPKAETIFALVGKIKTAVFPGYFHEIPASTSPDAWLQGLLAEIRQEVSAEVETALRARSGAAASSADEIAAALLEQLAEIQRLLYKDAEAGFNGDPAARSVEEVILSYPGFFAVFVYRVARFLFLRDVPFIPRMMSEHAHSVTGIDIHPGAAIGEYFFIDHGTGVVIGETAVIGNHVKLYQGVTLGALSTESGQKLAGVRRHPTIEDRVTIYAGATILGGGTVIGENATIGGNVFLTKSVPKGATIKITKKEGNENGREKPQI